MAPDLRQLGALGGLVLLGACARTEHTPVDVQVDVHAALPEAAVHVRLCVSGGPARSFGPGDGTYALTGLEPDVDPEVVVQAVDGERLVLGAAGPAVVEGGYAVLEWRSGGDLTLCEEEGGAWPEEDAWVLGVRFSS